MYVPKVCTSYILHVSKIKLKSIAYQLDVLNVCKLDIMGINTDQNLITNMILVILCRHAVNCFVIWRYTGTKIHGKAPLYCQPPLFKQFF